MLPAHSAGHPGKVNFIIFGLCRFIPAYKGGFLGTCRQGALKKRLMVNYVIVSLGAALGGVFRYGLSKATHSFLPISFPYGTLIVNITGSFLLGLIMFYLDPREIISARMRLFLTVGFCGGFTTFSTFSYETITLCRDSEFLIAGFNILANIIFCLAGVYLAYLFSKLLA